LLGRVLGDRYRITSVLGRGPMGIACEGESPRGRQVTLKLLPRPPELPALHFAWQVRQTLALAHFDHPHVTPINDFGAIEDGSAFVIRNRVPGVSLRSLLRQGGLPVWRSLTITRQIALALAAAHEQEIAHGRLKPENVIILGGAEPGDVVQVVDFGMAGLPVDLAAVAQSENEARHLALRTRLYLPAPEASATPAVDVYALGVMLFEMIAGQPPFVFEGLSPAGPAGPPLSFAQCNPPIHVPASVNDLVIGMMHPDAARHGVTAQRLVHMLDGLLGRPSVAPGVEAAPSQRTSSPHEPPPGGAPPSSPVASSPRPSAPHPGSLPARVNAPPTETHGPAGPPQSAAFWPPSTASGPGRASWPPLPEGYTGSSAPPPPVAYKAQQSSYPPGPSYAPQAYPPGAYPTTPAGGVAIAGGAPGGSAPGAQPQPMRQAQSFAPVSPSAEDDDTDFRPSLIGRLRRLFGRSKPGSGF
jgi:serine/threonine-protein kinase